MNDFRLRIFQSVAKNPSFTKTPQELFASQSTTAKHIQELETAYQTHLSDRQDNRISLTEVGKSLLKHCERVLEDYRRPEHEMHLLHNEHTGGLKLGASTTVAQCVSPPLLVSFIGKFPHVSLSLLNGNSEEIEAILQEHRINLGFVEGMLRLPNIRYTIFLKDELVAMVHTSSKLAIEEEITSEELLHLPLVLHERSSGTLDIFEHALQQHNIKLSSLQISMYLGSMESIELFLEHTDCLGIVFIRSITRGLYPGQLHTAEIKSIPVLRDSSFTQPQGQESDLARIFMQFAMHYDDKL